MPNWTESMARTYEYYLVDPNTWQDTKQLTTVTSCTIERDSSVETLGSASLNMTDSLGECYIRAYLITVQNGITEKLPLGTFLVQTPNYSFDGKVTDVRVDAYTPLLELKENPVPIGYYVPKDTNIMDQTYSLVRERVRAPVVNAVSTETIYTDFVANTDDNWLTFTRDLMSMAKFIFGLDETGRILFSPKQDMASLQPVWTYTDDNSSILYPDISWNNDMYGIPNVVEVVYTNGRVTYQSRVVNDDSNSATSTVNRGREIIYRDTNPGLSGEPTQEQIDEYATLLLKELSTINRTISYKHAYCPVRLGDCVRLNYTRAGLVDIKAKVISQSISCTPECPVTETAEFTIKLWR